MLEISLEELAKKAGFTAGGYFVPQQLEVRNEVREMCRSGQCGCFGACWACPPYCGTLEECAEAIHSRKKGFLVCSTTGLEDSFDYFGMKRAEAQHKQAFQALAGTLAPQVDNLLSLGAGPCTICDKCTCPDRPCRHPEMALSSMEGYGLIVSDVCQLAGIPYYAGAETVSFFSCYLFDDK